MLLVEAVTLSVEGACGGEGSRRGAAGFGGEKVAEDGEVSVVGDRGRELEAGGADGGGGGGGTKVAVESSRIEMLFINSAAFPRFDDSDISKTR